METLQQDILVKVNRGPADPLTSDLPTCDIARCEGPATRIDLTTTDDGINWVVLLCSFHTTMLEGMSEAHA